MTKDQLLAKLKLCQRKHRTNQGKVVDFIMAEDCLLQYINDLDIENNYKKIERPFPYGD